MGLFDFLKSKKAAETKDIESEETRFNKQVVSLMRRYTSEPKLNLDKIRANNEELAFSKLNPKAYEDWKNIQSTADKRSAIYQVLDSFIGDSMELWQIVERFNDDRYALRALKIATETKQEVDEINENFWNALARTNFILTNYEEAERNCQKAIEIDNLNIRTKRILADILHCTNRQHKAHELYNEILSEKIPKDQEIQLAVEDLLGFEGDIINSPIYALGWLESDKRVTNETWEWANEEFYYSPHFRSQYAFHLIKNREHMKGFVKLLNLSKEMPWFRDGVVNSYNLIDKLNLTDKMQDEKARLKTIIESKNWTDQDPNLHTFTL